MKQLKTFTVATMVLLAPTFAMALRAPQPDRGPTTAATVIDTVLARRSAIDEGSKEQAKIERKRAKAARKQAHRDERAIREAERERMKDQRKAAKSARERVRADRD